MKAPLTEQRSVRANDGGDIVYHVAGRGPTILFANGLAGSWHAFRNQFAHFAGRFRCIAWDYRGLYRDRSLDSAVLGVSDHARDALAILEQEQASTAVVIGWSFGVQVALELFALAPSRVAMLVLVCGGARPSWGHAPEAGPLRRYYPKLFAGLRRVPELLELLLRQAATSPEAVTWARRLAIVGDGMDAEQFAESTRDLRRLDVASVLQTLEVMEHADESPILSSVDVPTLVIGGDRDPFTSRSALERLVNSISGAEYLLLPGATHFVLQDHAQHVNLRIDKFLGERGYG